MTAVPFLALRPGEDAGDVDRALRRVIERGWFILGPEVEAFEREFAEACGARYAIGVATGTDAIALALRAIGVGPGDEVITSPLSAAFSGLAIMMAGARPVFADIDPQRLTVDPAAVEAAIGPRTRALLPVHIYGQPADMIAIAASAARHGVAVVEDCCQSHLATCAGRPAGSFGAAAAYSFYPTKNLGALGDGGAITTDDAALADRLRRLRNGGQTARYQHAEFGVNSRLDELQASVLRERLRRLPAWTARRRAIAAEYRRGLSDAAIATPPELDSGHVYHLFPVLAEDRDGFQAHLRTLGVETLVHYPTALSRQLAFAAANPAPCAVADRVCARVCSLPLNHALSDEQVAWTIEAVKRYAPRVDGPGSVSADAPASR
jgi:dTDP-3-amino-3,4,6-trideoxy-alpha-D-glucose transaminase